jgi:TonB-dependent Receptor Plug Domain
MRKIQLLLLAGIATGLSTFCQTTPAGDLERIATAFIKNLQADSSEKIFVQTDKWFYNSGDDIWFKAYVVNAVSGKLYRHSKTLYVDLVNDQDLVVRQVMLNNQQQKTDGKIHLNLSLPEGYYWLRAYTKKILREDTGRIFVKPLFVLNPRNEEGPVTKYARERTPTAITDTGRPVLAFFPEGGSIIEGTTALVAFSASTPKGNPLDLSGYVKDSRDSIVGRFSSSIDGLGKFSFDAWNRRKYTAYIRGPNNQEIAYPLPRMDPFASQISITDRSDGSIRIRVSLGDSLYKKNKTSYLLGVSGDSLCFAAQGTDMYELNIPERNFPDGMANLVLFDEQGKLVSDRAIYVDHNHSMLDSKTDKSAYGSREKIDLDFSVSQWNQQPVSSMLSVSVVDARFALTGEDMEKISGPIPENIQLPTGRPYPGWEAHYTTQEKDLLMLVQHSQWTGKYARMMPASLPDSNQGRPEFWNISGTVLGNNQEPMKNQVVDLIAEKISVLETDETNENGRFRFTLPVYQDSTKYTLKLTNKAGIEINGHILLDSFDSPHFHTPVAMKKRFNASTLSMLQHIKIFELDTMHLGKEYLAPVLVKNDKKEASEYDASKKISSFSHILTAETIERFGSISSALLTTPGVHIQEGFLTVGGGVMNQFFKIDATIEPLLVVDGVTMDLSSAAANMNKALATSPTLQFVDQFAPNTIDFVEVLSGPEAASYGNQGGQGVILINTLSKARVQPGKASTGIRIFYGKGYLGTAVFPFPDYSKKEVLNAVYPDLRSTIFWDGELYTDKDGKASVHFYTADGRGSYIVTMMGITSTGKLLYGKTTIKRP